MLTVQKTNKNLLYFAETYLAKTCKNTLYFAENYPNGEFRMSYYEFYQICMNQSKLDWIILSSSEFDWVRTILCNIGVVMTG